MVKLVHEMCYSTEVIIIKPQGHHNDHLSFYLFSLKEQHMIRTWKKSTTWRSEEWTAPSTPPAPPHPSGQALSAPWATTHQNQKSKPMSREKSNHFQRTNRHQSFRRLLQDCKTSSWPTQLINVPNPRLGNSHIWPHWYHT